MAGGPNMLVGVDLKATGRADLLDLAGEFSVPAPDVKRRLAVLQDRIDAEDFVAARIVAADLRVDAEDPELLLHLARASLACESPRDAVKDLERAKKADPSSAEIWFVLGLANNALGENGLALAALAEAERLAPDAWEVRAASASIRIEDGDDWRSALVELVSLQREHPQNDILRNTLAWAYLKVAYRGWPSVEETGSGTIVESIKGVIRLAAGVDVPPGLYPTTAAHAKTAAFCAARIAELGPLDRDLTGAAAELEDIARNAASRRYRATWGETGIGILLVLGTVWAFNQHPLFGLFFLVCGAGLLVGGFEPQYRVNRILLSRRGKSLGDAVAGLAQRHQKYGGIAYTALLMGTYPFIAIYKVYKNWIEGHLEKSEVVELLAPRIRPAAVQAVDDPSTEDQEIPLAPEISATPTHTDQVEHGSHTTSTVANRAPPPTAVARSKLSGLGERTARKLGDIRRLGAASFAGFVSGGRRRTIAIVAAVSLVVIGGLAFVVFGVRPPPRASDQSQISISSPSSPPTSASTPVRASPSSPGHIAGNPRITDTGVLNFGGVVVKLQGVQGEQGVHAGQMASFISEQGGSVTCEPVTQGFHRCWTTSGYDLAAAALSNGGARVTADAPDQYVQMQNNARAEKLGIWGE